MDDPPIREAATLILIRDPAGDAKVLLGRRQRNAVFMPGRFVFPGGAVDPSDTEVALSGPLKTTCRGRLAESPLPAHAYAAAAIRELWEETGLVFGTPGRFAPPAGWAGFADLGVQPTATGLTYVFRAITPPGQTRRFDARFFLADAASLLGDGEDFSGASGELSDLAWVPLSAADTVHMAPVTQQALQTVARQLPDLGPPETLVVRGQDQHLRAPSAGGPPDPSG